jgi:hypothetical protein
MGEIKLALLDDFFLERSEIGERFALERFDFDFLIIFFHSR